MMKQQQIIVYGHDFCGQALVLARALRKHDIEHEWRDVMNGPEEWQMELLSLANGNMSVPTVIFPDETVMVEPWPEQVFKKIGVEPKPAMARLRKLFGKNEAS